MTGFDVHRQPADVFQLLDEHHLVALSDHDDRRRRLCDSMESFLSEVSDTQIIAIDGQRAETLDQFCGELGRHLPPDFDCRPTIGGLVEALRFFPGEPMRRVFVWRDADVMLDQDVDTFARLVNALFAIAAEQEHLTPGRLVVQRVLLTGGSKLGAFADDDNGPFQRWLVEEDDDLNLWEITSCVDRPRVLVYRMDG
jgi:hypothetical protein